MKYDCDLIRDVAPLYKDDVLSVRGKAAVDEHLSKCGDCRKYYDEYSGEVVPVPETDGEAEKEIVFTKKIKKYRTGQIAVFSVALLALLTMVLPWFGYPGISELKGTVILCHPIAVAGVGLFFFAIWYSFRKNSNRSLCGHIGWGLLLLSAVYDFLTIPCGSLASYQFGPFGPFGSFGFDIPLFSRMDILKSFENALPGFYLGVAMILLSGIVFFFFTRKLKSSTTG